MDKCKECKWQMLGANYCSNCGNPIMETCSVCGKEEKWLSIRKGECENLTLMEEDFYDGHSNHIRSSVGYFLAVVGLAFAPIIWSVSSQFLGILWIVGFLAMTVWALIRIGIKEKQLSAEWEIEKLHLLAKARKQKTSIPQQRRDGWGF